MYTCITGDYDILQEPIYKDCDIDYIVFSDSEKKSDSWIFKDIPEDVKKLKNNVLINRYLKFNGQEYLKNYDYAIYIDGNMKVTGNIKKLLNSINNTTGLALHRHNSRNCLYNEAKVCQIKKKGNINNIKTEMKKFLKEGFPREYGLYEANVIAIDLNNEVAKKLLNDWYLEFANSECYRDQIIFPYIIWKNNFKFNDIGSLGINVHKNFRLKKVDHQ